jgi:hypothetical protein
MFLSTPVPTLRFMDGLVMCIQSGVLVTGTPCNLVDRCGVLTIVLLKA